MNSNILDIQNDSALPTNGDLNAVKTPYQTPVLSDHGRLKAVTMTASGAVDNNNIVGDTETPTDPNL